MLINENLIFLDLEAANKEEAITKLAACAKADNKISSVNEYINCVLEREKTYSTGVGNGIAIPHGKCAAVKEAIIVFGKCKSKIEWNSLDDKPVDLIFLLGVPEENVNNIHLKVLSQLSRKLMNEQFIELLRSVKTKNEVLEALADIQAD